MKDLRLECDEPGTECGRVGRASEFRNCLASHPRLMHSTQLPASNRFVCKETGIMPGQVRRSLQGRDRRDRLREPPHPVPACLSLDPGVELRVLSKRTTYPYAGGLWVGTFSNAAREALW